jgi:hypothetical protein
MVDLTKRLLKNMTIRKMVKMTVSGALDKVDAATNDKAIDDFFF